jgi:tRNA nucleotidyltransferase (CCA-adding enzyme)
MIKTLNLTDRIRKQLPSELVAFLQLAGETAASLKQDLYLVGGVVRDLLLKRTNLDLDLVAEGNAIKLAEKLSSLKHGRVIAHSRFNTAKIKWDKWSVDIACARSEGYEKPGTLPTIQPCDIRSDLIRRDFTINSMAVCLVPPHYGELIDLYKGQEDLEKGIIRVLHDNSFADDATRIWRAVRYEQRLDFRIEPHTLALLKKDIACLDTISGDRIRHELELCLEEERPEKALLRADELGLLKRICPSLEANEWLSRRIARARGMLQPYSLPQDLYLAFLVYHLTSSEVKSLDTYLKFPRTTSDLLRDTVNLKAELPELGTPDISLSRIYHTLHQYSQTAVLANLLAADSTLIRQRIEQYLNQLRHVQPSLTGEDLIRLGIPAGRRIRETLEMLLEARLDGKVTSREQEIELITKGNGVDT